MKKMNDTEKTETILNALRKKYASWGMGRGINVGYRLVEEITKC